MRKSKIVFLDRDGTIIVDKGYMYKPEELEFSENSLMALRTIQKKYELVVVTNQSGIGRGIFGIKDYEKFNDEFLMLLNKNGIKIQTSLYCPHGPLDNCDCRKPKTKLVMDWLRENNIELDKKNSYAIGDKMSDVDFAHNLGINGILISNDNKSSNYYIVKNLYEAAEKILC